MNDLELIDGLIELQLKIKKFYPAVFSECITEACLDRLFLGKKNSRDSKLFDILEELDRKLFLHYKRLGKATDRQKYYKQTIKQIKEAFGGEA